MAELSAFIIAKNEEHRISKAINSLKSIASEIIVVDSGSTDNTVKIAESLGAKVVFKEWPGYVKQKSYAESLCKNDWVINLDADEELSAELQDEIKLIFASDMHEKYLGYTINFAIMHRNDIKLRPFAPDNRFLRIYNRRNCSFSNTIKTTTHDLATFNHGIDYKGKIYDLNGVAYHYSATSIEQLVAKANFYSSEQAKDMHNLGRKISSTRLVFELPLWFFKAYIKRRYFVFGMDGFVDSVIFAFARFLKMAKARELQNQSEHKK